MPAVLLFTQDLERAGAQRQCVELALGLHREPDWRVEMAAIEPDGPLGAEIRGAGIPLHPCPRRYRWDLRPARRLADLTIDGGFDLVHSFLFLPNFYARLARLRHRPRVVISSLRSTGIEGLPRYVAEVLMAPLCDLIIANSEAGRRDLVARGVSARRIVGGQPTTTAAPGALARMPGAVPSPVAGSRKMYGESPVRALCLTRGTGPERIAPESLTRCLSDFVHGQMS